MSVPGYAWAFSGAGLLFPEPAWTSSIREADRFSIPERRLSGRPALFGRPIIAIAHGDTFPSVPRVCAGYEGSDRSVLIFERDAARLLHRVRAASSDRLHREVRVQPARERACAERRWEGPQSAFFNASFSASCSPPERSPAAPLSAFLLRCLPLRTSRAPSHGVLLVVGYDPGTRDRLRIRRRTRAHGHAPAMRGARLLTFCHARRCSCPRRTWPRVSVTKSAIRHRRRDRRARRRT